MGFSYFDGKRWEDITREERYFCSELFHYFKGREHELLKLLQDKDLLNKIDLTEEELKEDYKWELGYEVCFYRDFYKFRNEVNKHSPKRTFDFCLFSENRIIIIEAKVHQGFTEKQLSHLQQDATEMKKVINKDEDDSFKINTMAICSSNYIKSCRDTTKERFDLMLSWMDIFEFSNLGVFEKANNIFKS